MADYSFIAGIAANRQPYNVLPTFTHLDLGPGSKTMRLNHWPDNAPDDVNFIDVFGPLADARVDLQVVRNTVERVDGVKDPGLPFSFAMFASGVQGEPYAIHKGLRIPYRYAIPVTDSDPNDGTAHSDIFILWTGHGGYP